MVGFSDIVLHLCENEHVEGGMIFQLLEDLTEMSTMKNCKDIFGYIESKQDILGKVCAVVLIIVFSFHNDCYLVCIELYSGSPVYRKQADALSLNLMISFSYSKSCLLVENL